VEKMFFPLTGIIACIVENRMKQEKQCLNIDLICPETGFWASCK